jgi:hypothetical protein
MANHKGSEGFVNVGANTIAETRNYSYNDSANLIDDTVMGEDWATHQTGIKSWAGSVACFWDETDTNGQGALVNGASVTLNLYPEGDSSGDTYRTGTVTISNVSVRAAHDGMVEASFDFTGNGAPTDGTVA